MLRLGSRRSSCLLNGLSLFTFFSRLRFRLNLMTMFIDAKKIPDSRWKVSSLCQMSIFVKIRVMRVMSSMSVVLGIRHLEFHPIVMLITFIEGTRYECRGLLS